MPIHITKNVICIWAEEQSHSSSFLLNTQAKVDLSIGNSPQQRWKWNFHSHRVDQFSECSFTDGTRIRMSYAHYSFVLVWVALTPVFRECVRIQLGEHLVIWYKLYVTILFIIHVDESMKHAPINGLWLYNMQEDRFSNKLFILVDPCPFQE